MILLSKVILKLTEIVASPEDGWVFLRFERGYSLPARTSDAAGMAVGKVVEIEIMQATAGETKEEIEQVKVER